VFLGGAFGAACGTMILQTRRLAARVFSTSPRGDAAPDDQLSLEKAVDASIAAAL
jgi:hypothetical protein